MWGRSVQRAVDLVYSAYVARADTPRATFLREVGVTVEAVSLWEETGKDLVVKQAEK